jgi:flagellar P-ring protein precursor FlgI
MKNLTIRIFCLCLLSLCAQSVWAERIKDLASIQGIRSNQLIGYGLVVGLDGTGDTELFTKQSFKSMLNKLGVTIPNTIVPSIKNVAAVAIHAELPPFAKPGQRIDITISSIGNAKSLRGGSLLLAPLKGADGQVYAVGQGDILVGGLAAQGEDGSKITVNVPVVGRIPNGAIVERGVPSPFAHSDVVIFNLHTADFTTSKRLAETINQFMGPGTAVPLDAISVKVHVPENITDKVTFVSGLEALDFTPAETKAKIVVNSRTGTIVIGKHVTVGPAAVAHGNLIVTVSEQIQVSQPQPLSNGVTAITPKSDVNINQQDARMFLLKAGISLETIVNAVNRIGAAPSDLVAIIEALKQAGALNADLEVI